MNKIKKILIIVTCFCFAFVFLFSINFAPNNVKANYNLVNVADHLHKVTENYVDVNYGLVLLPNTAYNVSFDYNVISTNAVELKATVGYGELVFAYDIANANTVYPNLTSGTVTVTFITPSTFEVPNPILFVREARGSLHTSTVQISNVTVQFADENLGAIYEQGFLSGTHSPILPDIDDNFYAYNLISVPDHTAITVNQFFDEYKTSFSFEPNVTYIFSLRFDVTSTTASGLKFIVGYGDSLRFVEQLGVGYMTGSPNDTVMFSFTTPEVFQVSTSYLWLREIDASVLHTTTAYISDIFLRYYSEYEYGHSVGYSNGYSDGSREGYNAGASGTITTNWFTSFLSSTFDILNIEVFPNIKLIYLIFIPVGLGVLALILKMARG